VLVVVATWVLLDGYKDEDERMADENAGFVFNGSVNYGGATAAMNRVLRNTEPEAILLGPSYANTDVKSEIIADHLGLRTSDVAMLSVPNSVGAHWYAVLKYRVFGAGYRPKVIVVVSGLQSMLLNTPLTESSWVNLRVQMDDPADPEILERTRTSAAQSMGRFREQRAKVRDGAVGLMRDVAPLALFRSRARVGMGMGPLEVRANLDKVFDDDLVDMRLHTAGSSPVVAGGEVRGYDPSMLPRPGESFVPLITKLARSYGARIVWVRPPMSPDIPQELDDVVPEGFQAEMLRVLHEQGGNYVDMRSLPMSTGMFANEDHMNEDGSRRFSEALGRALGDLDVMQPEAIPGAVAPLTASEIRVEGNPGPPPEAEANWAGEGTWVGPGATLVARFDVGWVESRGVFAVKAVAEALTQTGAAPTLTVSGAPVDLKGQAATQFWQIWRADAVQHPPSKPFEVRFSVPETGAWTRIVGLALGRRAGRSLVLGDDVAVDGAEARVFGVFEVVEGALSNHSIHPTFLNKPGAVPEGRRPVIDVPRSNIGRYDTERWGFLSDEFLMGQSHFGSRCSPLRIAEDGEVLPKPNVSCLEVQRAVEGRTCHTPKALFFGASDGSDPASNGRAYKMVLDPGRRCDGFVWLYPKDQFTVLWPADALADFRRGATHFTFAARYLQKRKATMRVVLRVNDQIKVDEVLDGRDLWAGPKVWVLDPPVPPGANTRVELQVENQEHVFYLVEEAALSEGPLTVSQWTAGGAEKLGLSQ
jgi:hypothetical protein